MAFDPRVSLPRPSDYAARVAYHIGDIVLWCGRGYTVASILELSQPLHPDAPTGKHYVLRRADWSRALFLIVPAAEIEQPTDFAA